MSRQRDICITGCQKRRRVRSTCHAFSYKRDSQIKLGTLIKLKNNGLGGLEVNHYEHNLKSRKDAYEISKILGLLQFGSSDYHGSGKPNKLGENLTNLETILKKWNTIIRKGTLGMDQISKYHIIANSICNTICDYGPPGALPIFLALTGNYTHEHKKLAVA